MNTTIHPVENTAATGTGSARNALEIKGLVKNYPTFCLDHIDLTLPMGCVMGFIGENGAGKSTTILSILGAVNRDSGTVRILGQDTAQGIPLPLKEQIGVVLDECCLPETLNLKDINGIMQAAYRTWNCKTFFRYVHRFFLDETKRIKDYSRGMKMKLSIACALSHDSRLLILDEATSGLDPVTRDELLDLFYEFIQDEQHSIFMSSHITSDLEKICDYVTYIHKGKLLLCQEKDRLLGRMGILKCSEALFRDIDPAAVHGKRTTAFGVEALVERQKIPASFTVEHASLDDILIYLVKEDPLHAKNHITHF